MSLPIPDMSVLHAMLDALDDPRHLHAILIHAPIAVAALFPVAVLVLVCSGGRSHVLRWTTALGYLAAAVLAWYAAEAGAMAVAFEHAPDVRTAEALHVLERHESMGSKVPIILGVIGAMLVLTAIPKKIIRFPLLLLTLLASVAAAGWVGVTAYHGGELVYDHGVNTPATSNNATAIPVRTRPQPAAPPAEATDAPPAEDSGRKKGFFGIPTD